MSKKVPISTLLLVVLLNLSIMALPRLDEDVQPTYQLINLRVDPADSFYTGQVKINLDFLNPVDSFRIHSEELDIKNISLTRGEQIIPVTFEDLKPDQIIIKPEKKLEKGTAELTIDFDNNFNTNAISLYRLDLEEDPYLFTQMEDIEAREAFPCFDEPSFKFPYQVIITAPEKYQVISNMMEESTYNEDGWIRHVFKKSMPLPSYLFALAVGEFDLVPVKYETVPIQIVAPKGKGSLAVTAVESTPKLLKALEEYFDSPYPFDKLDMIAVPEFWPGAMENPGAITYAEGLLLFDPEQASLSLKRAQATTITHELAHMWFGDLVTMEWWDDLWLNESFATWIGEKITAQVYPDYDLELSKVGSTHRAMIGDARSTALAIKQPVSESSDLLGNIGAVYSKGHAVLNMFEIWMGEDAFRKAVLDYIKENEWGNAEAGDLWKALDKYASGDFLSAIRSFIEQPGVPLLEVKVIDGNKAVVTQERFSNYGDDLTAETSWEFPVNFKYSTDDGTKFVSHFLSSKSDTINLPADGKINWVLPNLEFNGYYRFNVPSEMLLKIADEGKNELTTAEKIGFINNTSALLDGGYISGGDFLGIIGQFGDDESSRVLSAVMGGIEKVRGAFITDDLKDQYSEYVKAMIKPAINKIGYEVSDNEDDEIKQLRPRLIATLAYRGNDQEAVDFVDAQFKSFLNDPSSIDPSLVSTIVSLGCVDGDMALFEEMKNRFENAETARDRSIYLNALGSFEDTIIQKAALEYTLNGPLRPQEFSTIPSGIQNVSDERADYIFEWVMNNYDKILEKIPSIYYPYIPYYASGCSKARLELAKEFFSQEEHNKEGTQNHLNRVSVIVESCITLREREQASVVKYLNQFVENVK